MYLGLTEYLEQSPQLKGQKFNFNWIGAEPVQYAISIPTNTPKITTDTMGNTKSQLNFYLVAVNMYGQDNVHNIKNLEFFQKLKKWFEQQNRKKNFPNLGEDKKVIGVYATTDGYIEATTDSIGRYQIQCKVQYIQINTNPKKAPLKF